MNCKFGLRLISVLGSSLILALQFAPVVQAQSGNMSDGTGVNINSGGNMSDATSVLIQQLLDGTLTEINGIKITAEIRALMLALINGDQRGIGQLVSFLVQAGVPGNLASEFARSLRGLFINGQINQAQLTIISQLYYRIVSTGGVNISFLNEFALFQAITAMLASFGVDVTIPIIIGYPVGAGNLSDATNVLLAFLEPEAEVEPDQADEVAEEGSPEAPVEVSESLPESPVEPPAETQATETTEPPLVAQPVSEPLPQPAADAAPPTEPPSEASAPAQPSSEPVAVNVTVTRNNSRSGNNGRFNHAGGVMAMNAIVTTSDIVGGRFQFASRSVLMAVLQGAKSLIGELLGEGEVFFAGQTISIEARQTVVTVMTTSSSVSVQSYVSSLTSGGVPSNYAQALGATMEGMMTVESSGEVSEVNATKLTTAIAVYNETISVISAEAVSQPSDVLSCTGYALSNLTQAAASGATQQANR
jgi:hypothetical protein